jgi:AraC family transcriptional activator of tynA and feaB
MHQNDEFLSAPELDYEGFRAAVREDWGCFSPASEIVSKVRARRVFGLVALDLTCNAARVERTKLDVRRDDMEYYYVSVQTGDSTIIHDDRVVNVAAGDVVLLDSTRPVIFAPPAQHRYAQWLGTCRARTWCRISASSLKLAHAVAGKRKLHVFSTNSLLTRSAMRNRRSGRLTNLCVWWSMISLARCLHRPPRLAHATPTNCSCESAASSRTASPIRTSLRVRWLPRWEFCCAICRACSRTRGSTCSHYISSLRLDHAAHLIERRASMKTGQPLSDIAYACGFRDYTHFARGFRQRFGSTPGAVGAGDTGNDKARVRADNGEVKRPYEAT